MPLTDNSQRLQTSQPGGTGILACVNEGTDKNVCATRSIDFVASRTWLSVAILSLLCFLLFFYGVGAGDLYRTEGLRAIIAQEFLRSGNWVVPKLYGEPFFTKPPCMYAAIAFASWPKGHVTEWSARLPSAVAATMTVFLFYWYFARSLGRLGGFLAAFILPLSFAWLDKASAAELDMMQVAWVSAAILFFLRGLEIAEWRAGLREHPEASGVASAPRGERSGQAALWFWWPAALLCVAGGVLTKWTAPVFFYGTVIPLLWWRGSLRLLFRRHHLGSAVVGAAACLAWFTAAILLEGWQPFYETVRREALVHLSPQHHRGGYAWSESFVHPLKVWSVNLPWSLVALFALRPAFATRFDARGFRLLQALHCWIWPNLLLWSLVPQHSIRHAFPLFPAISGLAAMVWIAALEANTTGALASPLAPTRGVLANKILPATGIILMALGVAGIGTRLVYVHAITPSRDSLRATQAKGERIAALVPLDRTLYLFNLKDDGLMFYYKRDVRRLASSADRQTAADVYCLLTKNEYESLPSPSAAEVIEWLSDQQGAPIVLVQFRENEAIARRNRACTGSFR
jgi:4-amino-4-deoxy-L-arabinose transferase-like glycosyltransferase